MKVEDGNVGFYGILFLIFMVLKLTGNIDWSWWYVTAPLWVVPSALLLIAGILAILGSISR